MFNFMDEINIFMVDNSKSNWAPYFRVLPNKFDNFGRNFTAAEISMLQGTDFEKISEAIRL